MYADEDTLNLLSAGQLVELLRGLQGDGWQYKVHGVCWLGLVSNLDTGDPKALTRGVPRPASISHGDS